MRLNLGCGTDYKRGWINCDVSKVVKADHYFDLIKGLPFESDVAEEIYIAGVLEQIGPNEQFLFVMNELHRVLRTDGRMTVSVPDASHAIAFRDPFDCRTFTQETWRYLSQGDRYYDRYGKVYGFLPWTVLKLSVTPRGIMTVRLAKAIS